MKNGTKRLKQVRILHPELFELGKQAILKFESDMVEAGLKKPEKLSDSKIVFYHDENVPFTMGAGG